MRIRRSTFILSAFLFLLAWILCGCAHSTFEAQGVKGSSWRLFWDTSGFEATLPTTNGTATIKLGRSGSDADALKAVAEGAAKGAVKGATGQ